MAPTTAIATRAGEYALLQLALPGKPPDTVGVLLLDGEQDRLFVRLRRDWEELVDPEDLELFSDLEDGIAAQVNEAGAASMLAHLEDRLSNVLLISEREKVLVDSFEASLTRLYKRHVAPIVLPFRTHLPQYSLRAAAGKFGESMEVEPEDWLEAPADLRLTDDMFVAHVVGRSMEPRIPDGSLCAFRGNVVGSRNGKLVLVMHHGEAGENRFTVKRYRSTKTQSDEGWVHDRITLEPLNPEYEAWDLEAESPIKVIGEFLRVLPAEG